MMAKIDMNKYEQTKQSGLKVPCMLSTQIGDAIRTLYANQRLEAKYVICDRNTYDKLAYEIACMAHGDIMSNEVYKVPIVIAYNGFEGFQVVPSAKETRKYIPDD